MVDTVSRIHVVAPDTISERRFLLGRQIRWAGTGLLVVSIVVLVLSEDGRLGRDPSRIWQAALAGVILWAVALCVAVAQLGGSSAGFGTGFTRPP